MLQRTDIDELEEAHLRELVDFGVPEIRRVDYKRALPAKSETAEFLADVCSFANASGGDLVYGVEEEGGTPKVLAGIATGDPDGDLLRLEQMILSGIDPRIPGLKGRYVPLADGNHVFVVRIPRSFARPHAVHRNQTPRFFSRNSAGKYPMDVAEIRDAVLASGTVAERMRSFRAGRLADVVAGESPLRTHDTATVVLHVMPLSSFDLPAQGVDLSGPQRTYEGLVPIGLGGNTRYNFDGLLCHGDDGGFRAAGDRRPESYALLFRSGVLEAVDSSLLWPEPDGSIIPGTTFERDVVTATGRYLGLLSRLGVEGPVYVAMSLLGVQGYRMAQRRAGSSRLGSVDRNSLVVPEVMAEGASLDEEAVERLMQPALDQIWNACGYAGSPPTMATAAG